jgi:uncharacterized protein (UPF0335 family)
MSDVDLLADDPPGKGHNSGDDKSDSYRVTAGELRQFVERLERLDNEKKDLADQMKEVMAEAKGRGYDTKVLRKLVALSTPMQFTPELPN